MPNGEIGRTFWDVTRRNWRPAVLYFVAPALLLPALITGGVLGVAALFDSGPEYGPDSAAVPVSTRAAAMLQLFGCLRAGDGECNEFRTTMDYLAKITADAGFTYTPLSAGDPGKPGDGGDRRVRIADLDATQARAVGAAVARTNDIPTDSDMTVARTGGSESVRFTSGDLTGAVSFTVTDGTFRLVSVIYRPQDGGR
jgi:hypothetical protein